MVLLVIILLSVALASAACCHFIARKRGVKPVFWGMMGAMFGPFAILFVLMAKPKKDSFIQPD